MKIAPIKRKEADKTDKSKIKCYYCQKNGHKSSKSAAKEKGHGGEGEGHKAEGQR